MLRRHLPGAIAGDDVGVHQARVASRRLREAIPVLATDLKAAKAKGACRRIRRLTRALGTVRELDVSLKLLDELAASDDLSRPALQDVRLHVVHERDRRREEMLAALAELDGDKLHRRLERVAAAVDSNKAVVWRQALATRIVRRTKWFLDAVEQTGQLYAPDHLHQVRIAAKKLRYAVELAQDSGIAAAARHVRALKRTQEMLGRLHDLQVLQQHVAAAQAAPVGKTVPHEGLGGVAGRIEEECRRLHGKYVVQIPALIELASAIRADVVPRLTRASRQAKMTLPHGHPRAVSRSPR